MTTDPNPKKAAVSYIENEDGKMLCVWNKRYNGWSLPGGKVEDGESVEAAQARELHEETGLETVSAKLIYSGLHGIKIEASRGSEVYVFRVVIAGKPREMEEDCPVTWMTRATFLTCSPFASFYDKVFVYIDNQSACDRADDKVFAYIDNQSACDHSACDHGVIFDAGDAQSNNLTSAEVQKKYPRLFGPCPKGCGFNGIAYASYGHYLYGDW